MSTLGNIDAALIAAFKTLDLGGTPVGYAGETFVPPNNAAYAVVNNLHGPRTVATLGGTGDDEYSGILQVDFAFPTGSGTKAVYDQVQKVLDLFSAGSKWSSGGQDVYVKRSTPSPIRNEQATAGEVMSVSVYWYSRSQR